MSDDSAEERPLPASSRKLQQARRKGQVARSRDAVMAAAVAASLLYLAAFLPIVAAHFEAVLNAVGRDAAAPFDVALSRVWPLVVSAVLETVLPLLLVIAVAVVLMGILSLRGLVVSIDPIVPRFDRINPAKGFKRLFRLAQLVELLKSLVKTAVLVALFLSEVWVVAGSLFRAPACGASCVVEVGNVLFAVLAAGVAAVFIVSAVVDLPLQQRLFRREMRMSHSEQKRERKDIEGDPQVRSVRRQRRADMLSDTDLRGLGNASMLLVDPAGACVGLRYVSGETPAPVVVCRAEGTAASDMVTQARQQGIPTEVEPELCQTLMAEATTLGSFVPEQRFRAVAAALLRAGVI